MKIDLICNDGSPIGVTPSLIWGRGVGGAELAMMTLMEVLAGRGHEVTVYNDPVVPGDYAGVTYAPLNDFGMRRPRDVLIVFRSPNARYHPRYRGDFKAFWWTTDQVTVGDFRALGASVDYVVTISPYHTAYHQRVYQIPADRIGHIDLGVRIHDYFVENGEAALEADEPVEKIRNRMIFCSIPDRGLAVLLKCWPRIKEVVEDASLVITSDYTLWGAPGAGNSQFRLAWARQPDVQFLGAIPRRDLIKEQLAAEIQAYPCIYEELFCISAAECQVAGAVPVTSAAGALETTNEFGLIVPGNPETDGFARQFAERISTLLTAERSFLEQQRRMMMAGAIARFDWSAIADRWEQLFEEGRLK